jgi:hypothetical protein
MKMENEMESKLELSGVEVDVLRGFLGEMLAERNAPVLSDIYTKLLEGSAVGKVVTISLSKEYVFEGDFLAGYLEQLDDYPDTPSQREWFVMDRFIGEEALSKLDEGYVMKVEEK